MFDSRSRHRCRSRSSRHTHGRLAPGRTARRSQPRSGGSRTTCGVSESPDRGEAEVIAVGAEMPQQRARGHERLSFAREEVETHRPSAEIVRDPLVNNLRRPVEDGQDASPLRLLAPHGFAMTDVEDAVPTKLARLRISAEVDGLEMADLIATKSPRERGSNTTASQMLGASPCATPRQLGWLLICSVKERLELLLGEGSLAGTRLRFMRVARRIPIVTNLNGRSAEHSFTDIWPAVFGTTHVVTKHAYRPLVTPYRRLGCVAFGAQILEEEINVAGNPVPRVLVERLEQSTYKPLARVDGAELQVPAELLIPPESISPKTTSPGLRKLTER